VLLEVATYGSEVAWSMWRDLLKQNRQSSVSMDNLFSPPWVSQPGVGARFLSSGLAAKPGIAGTTTDSKDTGTTGIDDLEVGRISP